MCRNKIGAVLILSSLNFTCTSLLNAASEGTENSKLYTNIIDKKHKLLTQSLYQDSEKEVVLNIYTLSGVLSTVWHTSEIPFSTILGRKVGTAAREAAWNAADACEKGKYADSAWNTASKAWESNNDKAKSFVGLGWDTTSLSINTLMEKSENIAKNAFYAIIPYESDIRKAISDKMDDRNIIPSFDVDKIRSAVELLLSVDKKWLKSAVIPIRDYYIDEVEKIVNQFIEIDKSLDEQKKNKLVIDLKSLQELKIKG